MDTIELDFAPAPAVALPPPRADRRAQPLLLMDKLVIEGGARLSGTIGVSGAKNAALPILCASLLAPEPLVLANVPQLNDVRTMRTLLAQMGVACEFDGDRLTLDAGRIDWPLLARSVEAGTPARFDTSAMSMKKPLTSS